MIEETITVSWKDEHYQLSVAHRLGGKETILLLHGLGCCIASFRDIWRRSEFMNCSLIALDFLGFGKSDRPHKFSYRLEDHAKVCEQVVGYFQPEQLHIVAHSMGSAIGLLMPVVRHNIQSFTSLEGNFVDEDCEFSRVLVSGSFEDFSAKAYPDFVAQAQRENWEDNLFFLSQTDPLGMYKTAQSLVAWSDSGEMVSRFKALECAKIYVCGEENKDAKAQQALGSIPTQIISNTGHFMMNENPDAFYSALSKIIPLH